MSTETTATRDPLEILREIREREQAATRGPWEADDDGDRWQLFGAVTPNLHPLQLIKAPKHGTPYAEYWPNAADSAFITAARTDVPRLLRVAEVVASLCHDSDGNWLPPLSELPVGEFQAVLGLLAGEVPA